MSIVLRALLLLALVSAPLLQGCSSNRGRELVRAEEPRAPAPTRPVVPIEEERPWYENAGEVTLVIFGTLVIIGGIVLPIILLTN